MAAWSPTQRLSIKFHKRRQMEKHLLWLGQKSRWYNHKALSVFLEEPQMASGSQQMHRGTFFNIENHPNSAKEKVFKTAILMLFYARVSSRV